MGVSSQYYVHTRLTSSGRLKHREISEAKSFLLERFSEQFSDLETDTHISHSLIQKTLMRMVESGCQMAETCLRCYVSNAIQTACLDLTQKFKLHQHFSTAELLSCVLDDINPIQRFNHESAYSPFALKILRTFNPDQGNLNHWTRRLVKQHPELNRLLKERGIYIASDWAILNQANLAQVKRLLSTGLTNIEIQRIDQLLNSFHQVYRADRLRQTGTAGKRCPDPTEDQLQRMVAILQAGGRPMTTCHLLGELRTLATHLRRAKRLTTLSLDHVSPLAIEQPSLSQEEVLLSKYYQLSEVCLYEAIQTVLQQQIKQLKTRNLEQANQFRQALLLFFVQGKSMSQIAPLIGLKQQFQVTRLLKLKQIRAAIQQQYVALIHPRLRQMLAEDLPPDTLAQLQLEPLLLEIIEQIMAEDATECYSAHRSCKSLLSLCICRFLTSYA